MKLKKSLFIVGLLALFSSIVCAQEQTPTPPEEPIRVLTEEVVLNVTAQTSGGKPAPMLSADDLLIVESGDPQTISSIKRVPASVLLLLDTGSQLTFAKSATMTRLAAKIVITNLSEGDTIAAAQFHDKIETVSDWTQDGAAVTAALNEKVFSGKRSRFSEAISAAVELFKSRPLENRHIVLISDGLDSVAAEIERQRAMRNLLAANITVHVISYTQMEERRAQKATQRVKLGDGKTKPRVPDYIFDQVLKGLAISEDEKRFLKAMNESQRIIILNLDGKMIKTIKRRREAWRVSEAQMQTLAEDTGGMFHAPEEPETFLKFAAEVAAAIGSQYVVTYTPTKPFAESAPGEERKIRVSTHRENITVRSRQKLVVGEREVK